MPYLIKLEFKKFNLKKHINSVIIANIFILLLTTFFALMVSLNEIPINDLPKVNSISIMLSDLLLKATFIVWESVLISIIIIEEFRTKTISLLFTYPISRKKLINAKLTLIVCITFVSIIISEIFQNTSIFLLSKIFDFVVFDISFKYIYNLLIISLLNVIMGLIPLFFGMLKKSQITTILYSLLIVAIVTNCQTIIYSAKLGIDENVIVFIITSVLAFISVLLLSNVVKKITRRDLY